MSSSHWGVLDSCPTLIHELPSQRTPMQVYQLTTEQCKLTGQKLRAEQQRRSRPVVRGPFLRSYEGV